MALTCGVNNREFVARTARGPGAAWSVAYLKSIQNIDPTLRCRPDFIHGMPVARDTRRFGFVNPTASRSRARSQATAFDN
jgi:hypothetical protein